MWTACQLQLRCGGCNMSYDSDIDKEERKLLHYSTTEERASLVDDLEIENTPTQRDKKKFTKKKL